MEYSWIIHGLFMDILSIKSGTGHFPEIEVLLGKSLNEMGECPAMLPSPAIACHRPAKSLLGPWRILVTMPSQKEVEDLASCSVDPSSVEEKQNLADGAHEIPFLYQYNSYIYIYILYKID